MVYCESIFHIINFRRIASVSNAAYNGANIFSKIIQCSLLPFSGLQYSTFYKANNRLEFYSKSPDSPDCTYGL